MPSNIALRASTIATVTFLALAIGSARAQTYDIAADWSDASNPNGPWSYNESANPLPHVDSWQRKLGGWNSPQPGWAYSEDSTNRIPFWYQSNGTENFGSDTLAGDVVVHTTDDFNGIGNGPGNVTWTSPGTGTINLAGAVWMTREIGRSNDWTLYLNGSAFTGGSLASGDPYSRAAPFFYRDASGGTSAIRNVHVDSGDVLMLRLVRTSTPGDFVGIRLTIHFGVLGDMNCDGLVNFEDIDGFVTALIDQSEYESQYPGCNYLNGDINADESVNFDDIDGFVDCLINGGCP